MYVSTFFLMLYSNFIVINIISSLFFLFPSLSKKSNVYTKRKIFIFIIIIATQLAYFEFLGLIIGKAVYEGILLDVAFAEFFLKKCLGGMNYCKYE